jgi:hypothetical protein
MQLLQQEVDLLADMIHSLDSFTNSQTRLVVIIDGLDNCEQDKMVQTLDALELLFCSRQSRPFIVTIAVDPQIIISAINHNMHSALTGTELTGHDYLKVYDMVLFYEINIFRILSICHSICTIQHCVNCKQVCVRNVKVLLNGKNALVYVYL